MGVQFVLNTTIGKDIEPEELEKKYDSVCYDTGPWKRPVAGISGES
jgi:NADPH-dependent glutamate synthase beta subunit-like oxidoreductase